IREREQEADRGRVAAEIANAPDEAPHLAIVDLTFDRAVDERPLARFEPPLTRHERLGSPDLQGVQPRAHLPADFEDVAEPLRGYQSNAGATPLEKRVRSDGGAVEDLAVARNAEALEALDDRAAGIGGRRRDLEHAHGAPVDVDEVRERPA